MDETKIIENTEELYSMNEPYLADDFTESLAAKSVAAVVPTKCDYYINGIPVYKHITTVNRTIYTNKKNKFIVIHWVGAQSSAKNNAIYFYGINRNASASYFVDDSSIWQVVEDNHAAWHCGGGLQGSNGHTYHKICMNANSIGIEMCCQKVNGKLIITDETITNTLMLVNSLIEKYNIPWSNVIRHYDVTGKYCPGTLINDTWLQFKWLSHKANVQRLANKGIINNMVSWSDSSTFVKNCNAMALIDKLTGNVWPAEESDVNIHWSHPHLISLCGKGIIGDRLQWMNFTDDLSVDRAIALVCKANSIQPLPTDRNWVNGFILSLKNHNIDITTFIKDTNYTKPITTEAFIRLVTRVFNV